MKKVKKWVASFWSPPLSLLMLLFSLLPAISAGQPSG